MSTQVLRRSDRGGRSGPALGWPSLRLVGGGLFACLMCVGSSHLGAQQSAPVDPDSLLDSQALAPAHGPDGATLFDRLSAERTGLDFVHQWTTDTGKLHVLADGMAGGGVCLGDADGDGMLDVFLTRARGGHRLYRNLGEFRFEDATEAAGLGDGEHWGQGASFADVDGDGDLDLSVCCYDEPNRLYLNDGSGHFREGGAAAGLDFSGASITQAFADIDGDGDLDAYLLTNRLADWDSPGPPAVGRDGRVVVPPELKELYDVIVRPDGRPTIVKTGQYDHLYLNDGSGRFTDVTAAAGIDTGATGNDHGLSCIWWDFDGDGDQDLYVANDFQGPDKLYRNDGAGHFTNIIKTAIPHTPWYSMGSDAGDVDNDGRLDFIATDMSGTSHYRKKVAMGDMSDSGWFLGSAEPRQYMRNALYLNTGTERFREGAFLAGLDSTDWTWSTRIADLDNDGWSDLFFANGMTRDFFHSDMQREAREKFSIRRVIEDFWNDEPRKAEPNMAFRNLGDLSFRSVGAEWGLDHEGVSFGASFGDLDGDGDLDLVVNDFEQPTVVYRNGSVDGRRLAVQLLGRQSNRHGVGATLQVELGGELGLLTRHLTLSRGFMSSTAPVAYFGLGSHADVLRLRVRWPSGHEQVFEGLEAGRLYTVTEPEGAAAASAGIDPATPLFAQSALSGVHTPDQSYDDFARQPLLPYQLSRLGHGLAAADVDGDGDDDLLLSGSMGKASVLLRNDGGRFTPTSQPHLSTGLAQDADDMTPLFLDVDGDGDQDLYMVAGGVACKPRALVLKDRLYLNDGDGGFRLAPGGSHPGLRDSSGAAAAADVDGDGDLDLFVGGRSVPGAYPELPVSHLLINDGGRFTDATDALAPGLGQTGLVTAALWSDADGDGDPDLLIAHEWGPLKLWRNELRDRSDGKLVDATSDARLSERSGWWNGLAGRDIDNDGDMDYVITNVGLNTKYHARTDLPVTLLYGDFDGSGESRIIEIEAEGNTLFPGRGKSCSTNAMPMLADKFPTFETFASASLSDIYTEQCLDSADRYEANTLESGVYLNDGQGRFTFVALPRMAQITASYGVLLEDVDGDGLVDIALAQNFFGPQVETGHFDGGVGQLLLGGGDGSFQPIGPLASGLLVPEDGMSLVATDLNGDGRVDMAMGLNDDAPKLFVQRASGASSNGSLAVRLDGAPGNPTAVGAWVTVITSDGVRQTAEVQAGGSYLSQSSATLFFGVPNGSRAEGVEVRWPDGRVTEHVVDGPVLRLAWE